MTVSSLVSYLLSWSVTQSPDKLPIVNLPAGFIVWAATHEADFARGRTLWANWDVGELKERAREIVEKNLLVTTIEGWATYMPDPNSEVFKGIVADLLSSS